MKKKKDQNVLEISQLRWNWLLSWWRMTLRTGGITIVFAPFYLAAEAFPLGLVFFLSLLTFIAVSSLLRTGFLGLLSAFAFFGAGPSSLALDFLFLHKIQNKISLKKKEKTYTQFSIVTWIKWSSKAQGYYTSAICPGPGRVLFFSNIKLAIQVDWQKL